MNGRNTQACLVCAQPKTVSTHFGSMSCLACAAFFRRTVSLSIEFKCKNQGSCAVYYELRMICRSCRFNKCLEAGMRRQCVQKRRTDNKKQDCQKNTIPDVNCEKILSRKDIVNNSNIEGSNNEKLRNADYEILNVKISAYQNFGNSLSSNFLYTDDQLLSTPSINTKENYNQAEPDRNEVDFMVWYHKLNKCRGCWKTEHIPQCH